MFFVPANYRHAEFRRGALDSMAVAPGIAAWGLMTGVAMMKSGMSTAEALLMSVIVFAGSSQLAAIPLLTAGAPMWVILATGFCVNLRFVVFSAHMRPYVMHLPLWQRLLSGYLTTDLSYVLFTQRFPQHGGDTAQLRAQEAYLAGNCGVNWFAWVGCSVLGVLLANLVPTSWGLGFAGILALLGILCSLAASRLRLVSAGVAGAAAVAAFALPFKLNILLAIAAAVACCLMLESSALSRSAKS
jgi:predicted branched-subunit amino acid permease